MKRIVLLLVLSLLFFSGCRRNVENLPPARFSGKGAMQPGSFTYDIIAESKDKKIGESILYVRANNNLLEINESIRNDTAWLDEKTLEPEKVTANYTIRNVPTQLTAKFLNDLIHISIESHKKIRKFVLRKEKNTYPDNALSYLLSGFDFKEKNAYIYDYWPYTSLLTLCTIHNLGSEKRNINGKEVTVYHIVLDFGREKRNLYYSVKAPHILLEKDVNGLDYILKH